MDVPSLKFVIFGARSAPVRVPMAQDYSPRGNTSLTLATLGTPKEAQEIDTLSPQDSKRYMHHYNFPPFSTGEAANHSDPAVKSGMAH